MAMTDYRKKQRNLQWSRRRYGQTGQESNKRGQPLKANGATRRLQRGSLAGAGPFPTPHQARSDHQLSALSPRGSMGCRTTPTLTRS